MIQKVYTVYDSKAEAYLQPFFATTKGLAIRSFSDAANKEGHNLNRYAEDYTLFEIGEWDDEKASLTMHPAKQSIGSANEYIKNDPNPNWPRQAMEDSQRDEEVMEREKK
jgi:hypothetical protein